MYFGIENVFEFCVQQEIKKILFIKVWYYNENDDYLSKFYQYFFN